MNVQSVDNSINVVEITNDQVFQRTRETIQATFHLSSDQESSNDWRY